MVCYIRKLCKGNFGLYRFFNAFFVAFFAGLMADFFTSFLGAIGSDAGSSTILAMLLSNLASRFLISVTADRYFTSFFFFHLNDV